MSERKDLGRELSRIEQDLKELEILYEQYFAGVEKREPVKQRDGLAQRLRHFTNRRITQTDLRFRYQTLAARFHSYATYWDRILRQIDEGRYVRQQAPKVPVPAPAAAPSGDETEAIYRELLLARQACNLKTTTLDREQVSRFIEQQREKIREKFGDRAVEFRVVTEDGKPKIKVRAKKS
ncbi:hypothetical protein DESUT3_37980 [Desulfuromonas versatilis]|uniref:Uncharacterized protein n=1 Tax=Desulfuromonas versatilis TaxID=2802975 RepID=A0ABM8HXH9_9BACT|nr:MXAN_5187 C-terminal domain-containing protein [Desulfuromonas versatilis]BCR06729.1 hypothetical protein DESUT3_37980 [Desulfuromonas versatilis]